MSGYFQGDRARQLLPSGSRAAAWPYQRLGPQRAPPLLLRPGLRFGPWRGLPIMGHHRPLAPSPLGPGGLTLDGACVLLSLLAPVPGGGHPDTRALGPDMSCVWPVRGLLVPGREVSGRLADPGHLALHSGRGCAADHELPAIEADLAA